MTFLRKFAELPDLPNALFTSIHGVPGDSGAPLVDQSGAVMGVAFAIDPGHQGTAYALTNDELRAVLDDIPADDADTGSCLVG